MQRDTSPESVHERRLAAVLCADVVGYSRLMGADEDGTLAALRQIRRTVVDARIAATRGRIFKTTGDGLLAEFASAVAAVRSAVEIQAAMARMGGAIQFRIGINLGDVIHQKGDVFGDGVNVAARLEQLADPGTTCISQAVFGQVVNRLAIDFERLGERQVKNIAEPVTVYRVTAAETYTPAAPLRRPFYRRSAWWAVCGAVAVAGVVLLATLSPSLRRPLTGTAATPVARPAMPQLSVAVLPFTNVGGDSAQDAFVDGITDDLITDLSRISDALVIARSTSFAFKGKAVDARTFARDVGVRYVLAGDVRLLDNRIRVNAELVDGVSGAQMWADRFDIAAEDAYALQDAVTGRIARALNIHLKDAVSQRAARGRPDDLQASDLATHGWVILFNRPQTRETNEQARPFLEEAVARDPHNAEAWTALAYMHTRAALYNWSPSRQQSLQEAIADGEKAVALDPRSADAYYVLGFAVRIAGDEHRASQMFKRCIELNPNYAPAYFWLGFQETYAGRPEAAIPLIQKAFQLSPRDGLVAVWHYSLGYARMLMGDDAGALRTANDAIGLNPKYPNALWLRAAALGNLGRLRDAQAALAAYREVAPDVITIAAWQAQRTPATNERYRVLANRAVEGLRKAGLPDR